MPVRAKPLPRKIAKRLKKSQQKVEDEDDYWRTVEERRRQENSEPTPSAKKTRIVSSVERDYHDSKETRSETCFFVQERVSEQQKLLSLRVRAEGKEVQLNQNTVFVQPRKVPKMSGSEVRIYRNTVFVQARKGINFI